MKSFPIKSKNSSSMIKYCSCMCSVVFNDIIIILNACKIKFKIKIMILLEKT